MEGNFLSCLFGSELSQNRVYELLVVSELPIRQ